MQFLLAALAAILLTGCSSHDTPKKPDAPTYLLYSPNGEPLNGGPLGRPTCHQAMTGWFNRLSAGSLAITKDTFMKDAEAQFLRMDIDHNGYIVSEELDRFREPYRQQQPARKQENEDSGGKRKRGGKGGKSSGSQSDPSLTMADPVMSADTNLDFKVTPQEFLQQAEENFVKLDTSHNGTLEQTEILTACDPKR